MDFFDFFIKYYLQYRFFCLILALFGFIILGIYSIYQYVKFLLDIGKETIRSLLFKTLLSILSGLIVFIGTSFPVLTFTDSKLIAYICGIIVSLMFMFFIPKDWMTL